VARSQHQRHLADGAEQRRDVVAAVQYNSRPGVRSASRVVHQLGRCRSSVPPPSARAAALVDAMPDSDHPAIAVLESDAPRSIQ